MAFPVILLSHKYKKWFSRKSQLNIDILYPKFSSILIVNLRILKSESFTRLFQCLIFQFYNRLVILFLVYFVVYFLNLLYAKVVLSKVKTSLCNTLVYAFVFFLHERLWHFHYVNYSLFGFLSWFVLSASLN